MGRTKQIIIFLFPFCTASLTNTIIVEPLAIHFCFIIRQLETQLDDTILQIISLLLVVGRMRERESHSNGGVDRPSHASDTSTDDTLFHVPQRPTSSHAGNVSAAGDKRQFIFL